MVVAAESVSVLLPLPGDARLEGANFAVIPLGRPLTESAIADWNPFSVTEAIMIVLELPAAIVAFVALDVNVKAGLTTVTAISALRVSPPPVPLIVTVYLPAAVLAAALMVAATGMAPVTVAEEKRTVTAAVPPVAASATGEENPPCAV